MKTLEEVVDHYAKGAKVGHANQSRLVRPLHLSDADKGDLIEFPEVVDRRELLRDPRWSDPSR